MDILLLNPAYITPENHAERFEKTRSLLERGNMYVFPFEPPLGLASLMAVLRADGVDAFLLDMQGDRLGMAQVEAFLKERRPPLVGITAMTTTYPSAVELADLVKRVLPSASVIMGGVHPTVMPAEVLAEPSVDYIVRGEGETALLEFFRRGAPEGIRGFGYKRGGLPVVPEKTVPIREVDSLPMPDYHSFPAHEYIAYNKLLRSINGISMIVSRGCPFDCSFCAVKETMDRGYRIKHPRLVVDEMRRLKESFGVEGIWFKDSIFNLRRTWIDDFCNELEKASLGMEWQINTRVDLADEAQIARMASVGLTQIDYGIESGSPATLKTLDKHVAIEQIETAVATAKKHVKVSGFFMIGVPGETEEDVEMTFALAKRLELDRASWSVFTPLPGSRLYDLLLAQGRLPQKRDWRSIHFIDVTETYADIPHEKLMARFWEIQKYFTETSDPAPSCP